MVKNHSIHFLLIILIAFLTILYLIFKSNILGPVQSENSFTNKPSNTLTPTIKPESTIKSVWIKTEDLKQVFLLSNIEKKQDTSIIIETNNCQELISGGFYTKNDKHIGLFVSEYNKISEKLGSDFYNGFVSVSNNNRLSITAFYVPNSRISLQSGPIIIENSKPKELKLNNDESARRIVVAQTSQNNEAIFIVIYNSENNLFGPKLSELPQIIERLSKENDLKIINALNLDGGSHSAFITKFINIPEVQTVGSIFCIKN